MACPKCRARRLVEIGVTVSGKSVKLHSCSACSEKWWDDDRGEQIRLDEVLHLAAAHR